MSPVAAVLHPVEASDLGRAAQSFPLVLFTTSFLSFLVFRRPMVDDTERGASIKKRIAQLF